MPTGPDSHRARSRAPSDAGVAAPSLRTNTSSGLFRGSSPSSCEIAVASTQPAPSGPHLQCTASSDSQAAADETAARRARRQKRREERAYQVKGWEDLYGGGGSKPVFANNPLGSSKNRPQPESSNAKVSSTTETTTRNITSRYRTPSSQSQTVSSIQAASSGRRTQSPALNSNAESHLGSQLPSSSAPAPSRSSTSDPTTARPSKRKAPSCSPQPAAGRSETPALQRQAIAEEDSDDDFEIISISGPAAKRSRVEDETATLIKASPSPHNEALKASQLTQSAAPLPPASRAPTASPRPSPRAPSAPLEMERSLSESAPTSREPSQPGEFRPSSSLTKVGPGKLTPQDIEKLTQGAYDAFATGSSLGDHVSKVVRNYADMLSQTHPDRPAMQQFQRRLAELGPQLAINDIRVALPTLPPRLAKRFAPVLSAWIRFLKRDRIGKQSSAAGANDAETAIHILVQDSADAIEPDPAPVAKRPSSETIVPDSGSVHIDDPAHVGVFESDARETFVETDDASRLSTVDSAGSPQHFGTPPEQPEQPEQHDGPEAPHETEEEEEEEDELVDELVDKLADDDQGQLEGGIQAPGATPATDSSLPKVGDAAAIHTPVTADHQTGINNPASRGDQGTVLDQSTGTDKATNEAQAMGEANDPAIGNDHVSNRDQAGASVQADESNQGIEATDGNRANEYSQASEYCQESRTDEAAAKLLAETNDQVQKDRQGNDAGTGVEVALQSTTGVSLQVETGDQATANDQQTEQRNEQQIEQQAKDKPVAMDDESVGPQVQQVPSEGRQPNVEGGALDGANEGIVNEMEPFSIQVTHQVAVAIDEFEQVLAVTTEPEPPHVVNTPPSDPTTEPASRNTLVPAGKGSAKTEPTTMPIIGPLTTATENTTTTSLVAASLAPAPSDALNGDTIAQPSTDQEMRDANVHDQEPSTPKEAELPNQAPAVAATSGSNPGTTHCASPVPAAAVALSVINEAMPLTQGELIEADSAPTVARDPQQKESSEIADGRDASITQPTAEVQADANARGARANSRSESAAASDTATTSRPKGTIADRMKFMLRDLANVTGRRSSYNTIQKLKPFRAGLSTPSTIPHMVEHWQDPATLIPWTCLQEIGPAILHRNAHRHMGKSMHELMDKVSNTRSVRHLSGKLSDRVMTRALMEFPRIPHMLHCWNEEKLKYYESRGLAQPTDTQPEFRFADSEVAAVLASTSGTSAPPTSATNTQVAVLDRKLEADLHPAQSMNRPMVSAAPLGVAQPHSRVSLAGTPAQPVQQQLRVQSHDQHPHQDPLVVGVSPARPVPIAPQPQQPVNAAASERVQNEILERLRRQAQVEQQHVQQSSAARNAAMVRRAADSVFSGLAADCLSFAEHVIGSGTTDEVSQRPHFSEADVLHVVDYVVDVYKHEVDSERSLGRENLKAEERYAKILKVQAAALEVISLTKVLLGVKMCLNEAAAESLLRSGVASTESWLDMLCSAPKWRGVKEHLLRDQPGVVMLSRLERNMLLAKQVDSTNKYLEHTLETIMEINELIGSISCGDEDDEGDNLIRRECFLIAGICCKHVVGILADQDQSTL